MEKKCLLCRSKSTFKISSFEESEIITKKVLGAVQIDIIWIHSLIPYYLCDLCLRELDAATHFRHKCTTFSQLDSSFKGEVESSIVHKSMNKYSNAHADFKQKHKSKLNSICTELTLSEYKQGPESVLEKSMHYLKPENSFISQKKKIIHRNVNKCDDVNSNKHSTYYHCNECDYSTPYNSTLVNHMRRHSGQKPYTCNCGKAFAQYSSLCTHKKSHSSKEFYACNLCGKKFKYSSNLTRHKTVHQEASFLCQICNKLLKSRESLKAHLDRHENIRNYNCEECGDTFVTSSELITHRKKHASNEKKLECNFCGYKTNKRGILILHLKRHSGTKSNNCTTCKESFYTKNDLKVHLRIHTREKPYQCSICLHHFAHKSSLNKHMKVVHGALKLSTEG